MIINGKIFVHMLLINLMVNLIYILICLILKNLANVFCKSLHGPNNLFSVIFDFDQDCPNGLD